MDSELSKYRRKYWDAKNSELVEHVANYLETNHMEIVDYEDMYGRTRGLVFLQYGREGSIRLGEIACLKHQGFNLQFIDSGLKGYPNINEENYANLRTVPGLVEEVLVPLDRIMKKVRCDFYDNQLKAVHDAMSRVQARGCPSD